MVFDAFDRTTEKPWNKGNAGNPTSAWWSNLEAIIAFDFAIKNDLVPQEQIQEAKEVLLGLTNSYFSYFLDQTCGGEIFRVDALTRTSIDKTKGGPGKSAYHLAETYYYLFTR